MGTVGIILIGYRVIENGRVVDADIVSGRLDVLVRRVCNFRYRCGSRVRGCVAVKPGVACSPVLLGSSDCLELQAAMEHTRAIDSTPAIRVRKPFLFI